MIHDMTKGAAPFLQLYLVPLSTGAAYRVAVMARAEDGEDAARRMAELAGAAPAWDDPASLPRFAEEEEGATLAAPAVKPSPPSPIDHAEAAAIASQWGSLIRAGDPGAIFYTFPHDAAPEWSRDDRAAALAYCDSCLAIARGRAEEEDAEEEDAEEAAEDVAALQLLRAYIVAGASVAPWDMPDGPRYTAQELDWIKEDAEGEGRPVKAFSFILTRDVTESQSFVAFGVDQAAAEDAARAIAEARPGAWAVDDGNAWDSPYVTHAEEEDAGEELAAAYAEAGASS